MSLAEIQELLGHEAEAMTRRYAHVAPDKTVDDAGARIARRITRAMEGAAV